MSLLVNKHYLFFQTLYFAGGRKREGLESSRWILYNPVFCWPSSVGFGVCFFESILGVVWFFWFGFFCRSLWIRNSTGVNRQRLCSIRSVLLCLNDLSFFFFFLTFCPFFILQSDFLSLTQLESDWGFFGLLWKVLPLPCHNINLKPSVVLTFQRNRALLSELR